MKPETYVTLVDAPGEARLLGSLSHSFRYRWARVVVIEVRRRGSCGVEFLGARSLWGRTGLVLWVTSRACGVACFGGLLRWPASVA